MEKKSADDSEKPHNVRNRPLIVLLFFTFKKKVNDLLYELLDNEYFWETMHE